MVSVTHLIEYGNAVQEEFRKWSVSVGGGLAEISIDTFYGLKSMHELTERTAWHCAQHARQLEHMLGSHESNNSARMRPELLEGLPIPDDIWDE
jgi:hypothetical protein